MHYHFMGIGGIGMSGLAQILLESGHTVSGCDLSPSELAYRLEARGALVLRGHAPEHITPEVDVLVTSTAVAHDHPEVIAARAHGKRVIRRIELLGELMAAKRSVGVVGTHGKTTTSSMIAAVFERSGLRPTAVIGGEVDDIGGNAKLGDGPDFVAEVDESDPYFQHLAPRTAVITNVEDDHIATPGETRNNYHASVEALNEAFRHYAKNADTVVYCRDWPGLEDLVAVNEHTVSYGTAPGCDYRAVDVSLENGRAAYTLEVHEDPAGRVELRVPGMHNVLNSLAAAAVADRAGVPFPKIAEALAAFRGAHRRWEKVGEVNGAWVYDDYAHNPTKVGAAIAGANTTGRRVRVVFQPHRFMRTAKDWERFVSALMPAHEVLVLDIYGAGEAPIEGVHASRIAAKLSADGHPATRYFSDPEGAVKHLLATAGPEDVIVTMGAGDVWKVGTTLLERSAAGARP
jgi:UDP-N-acetylmuramate--alanine ligase